MSAGAPAMVASSMRSRRASSRSTCFKRVVGGHVLYSHVVSVEGQRMILVSGQLARDYGGNIVGRGDMRAQIRER